MQKKWSPLALLAFAVAAIMLLLWLSRWIIVRVKTAANPDAALPPIQALDTGFDLATPPGWNFAFASKTDRPVPHYTYYEFNRAYAAGQQTVLIDPAAMTTPVTPDQQPMFSQMMRLLGRVELLRTLCGDLPIELVSIKQGPGFLTAKVKISKAFIGSAVQKWETWIQSTVPEGTPSNFAQPGEVVAGDEAFTYFVGPQHVTEVFE